MRQGSLSVAIIIIVIWPEEESGHGGGVSYLKGTLEHIDEEFIGDDVQLLLIFALNVCFSNCCTANE